jgi:hypothetical protein
MVCVSTNHIPHHPGARYLPVVWCNLKIHSFSKNQSRVVKGQADWEKFFEQVGANEIRSCLGKTPTWTKKFERPALLAQNPMLAGRCSSLLLVLLSNVYVAYPE